MAKDVLSRATKTAWENGYMMGKAEGAADNARLRAVAEAARAEVLARGYRSTDMAKAMKALWGEFWFETPLSNEGGGDGA
jgi:hypothetical protein